MKLLFLTNIPSPYRVLFFNQLSGYCDLTVLYDSVHEVGRNGKWKAETNSNYRSIFLPKVKFGNKQVICPSVVKFLKDSTYDAVILGGYNTPTEMLAIQYLRYKKIPFFLNSDGGFIKDDSSIRKRIKTHFIGSAYAWLSTGNCTSKYLSHYGAKLDRTFTYPFTSLVQEDIISHRLTVEEKSQLKTKLKIEGDKVAIAVGQFINRKGLDLLLNVWNGINKKYHLIIIGGGEKKTEYQKFIFDKGLDNVQIVDFMNKDVLFQYYKACDLFIMPTREDIWGLVVNEAMACGLPVISTNRCIAGLELVRNNENGFIIPVEDEKELADKVNLIMSDDRVREEMSQKSLEKIKPYTIENMTKRHMQVIELMLGENR